jgi:LAS superfamily LD-carboxypeptidase LdcB
MSEQDISLKVLCGLDESRLQCCGESKVLLEREAGAAFEQLRKLANQRGIDLAIASGYRSFARQCAIWNAKVLGQRPVLDDHGLVIDMAELSDLEKVLAIMRWSALPGASRHHWGTDLDVWDRAAVSAEYCLQLVPEEYAPSGPFRALADFFSTSQFESSGFYRPYWGEHYKGGVAPEPWHLSYRPLASRFEQRMSVTALAEVLVEQTFELKTVVLDNLDMLYQRFVVTTG